MARKKSCLVTGGAGFIGSHMVDALLETGYSVRVLDNLSTGRLDNLKDAEKKIEFIKGDIRKEADVRKAVRQMDYVIHIAANRAVLRSVDNPLETDEVNVTGTLKLLLACRQAKVKRFVFSSSSSVYGDNRIFPLSEKLLPSPESPYAASKITGEYYCRLFTHLYGLETVSLRYFNVFGPRQNPESKYSAVIPIFIDALHKKRPVPIHWDGRQSRDFSYVDNVTYGNLLALRKPGVAGEVFNIACHGEHSILEIYRILKRLMKVKEDRIIREPKRAGDVRRTFADIRKAEKKLRFKVQTGLEDGLKKTVEWFYARKGKW